MEKVKAVNEYIEELSTRGAKCAVDPLGPEDDTTHFTIRTAVCRYRIAMRPPKKEDGTDGYMGCIASCIDDGKGNDLPDGPYSDKTWHAIMVGIVEYEVRIAALSARVR